MTDCKYRLATPADELHILTAFSKMLRELEQYGHDILPTDENVDFFTARIFLPALSDNKHGIVLAFNGDECIGAILSTPEKTPVHTTPNRCVCYGEWVHPDWRRNGIGVKLQQVSYARLKELGFTSLVSNVLKMNVSGLRSHLKAGAEIIGYVTQVDLKAFE